MSGELVYRIASRLLAIALLIAGLVVGRPEPVVVGVAMLTLPLLFTPERPRDAASEAIDAAKDAYVVGEIGLPELERITDRELAR